MSLQARTVLFTAQYPFLWIGKNICAARQVEPFMRVKKTGRAFYEGCEFYAFNVNLRRSRDFFPDKLTRRSGYSFLPLSLNSHALAHAL